MRKYFFILFLFFVWGSVLGQDTLLQIDSTIGDTVKVEMQKSAGVQVRANSGTPGEGMDIVIRGRGAVGENRPLYVVDGYVVGDTCDIDPSYIESLSILKDASSGSIFPTRQPKVIIITTIFYESGGYFNRDRLPNCIPKTKFETETSFVEFIEKQLDMLARQHNIVEPVDVFCYITETGRIEVLLTSVEYDYIFNQHLITKLEEGVFWFPSFEDSKAVSTLHMFEFNFTDN